MDQLSSSHAKLAAFDETLTRLKKDNEVLLQDKSNLEAQLVTSTANVTPPVLSPPTPPPQVPAEIRVKARDLEKATAATAASSASPAETIVCEDENGVDVSKPGVSKSSSRPDPHDLRAKRHRPSTLAVSKAAAVASIEEKHASHNSFGALDDVSNDTPF